MANILIADDEHSILKTLALLLKKQGYNPFVAPDIKEAKQVLEENVIDIAFLDIRLGRESGIVLLDFIKSNYPDTSVIMISAFSSIDDTLKALNLGAEAYIAKPVRIEEAIFHINKIMEKRELILQNKELKKAFAISSGGVKIVGVSKKMMDIIDMVHRIKDLPSAVLIEGESGTGKEVIAKAIHYFGIRKDRPFIGVNCSAIPSSLFESEFFGYKRGSFTGAVSDFEGLFSQSRGGTFYLDDVDDIPMEFQPKLLRVLQENTFRRIGDPKEYFLECRIIASSKDSLIEKVESQSFRRDLYYRLNIINIPIPPLRERREDIIPLAEYFAEKKQIYLGMRDRYLSKSAKEYLIRLDYKGNVRELENIIERALVFSKNNEINKEDIESLIREQKSGNSDSWGSLRDIVRDKESEVIRDVLDRFGGNRTLAAKELSISIRTLLYKIKEYNL